MCESESGATVVQTTGDELQLVYPQPQPERFVAMAFSHFFLQPMDSADLQENIQAAIRYCLDHPRRKLSLQTHKIVGIP